MRPSSSSMYAMPVSMSLGLAGALVLLATAGGVLAARSRRRHSSDQAEFPRVVPSRVPYFGAAIEMGIMSRGPFCEKYLADEDVALAYIMGRRVFLVSGDYIISQIVKNESNFISKVAGGQLLLVGKHSILNVNGPVHKVQRNIILKFVDRENLSDYVEGNLKTKLSRLIDWFLEQSKGGNFFDCAASFADFAFDANARLIVGDTLSEADMKAIHTNFDIWKKGFASMPINLWFTTYGRALKARHNIDQIVLKEVRRRQAQRPLKHDLLQAVIECKNPETQTAFSEKEIIDQFISFFIAAMDTTVGAEWYAVYLMATKSSDFKNAFTKIREEVRALGKSSWKELTYDDLVSLPYLNAAKNEVLRCATSAPIAQRMAVEDIDLSTESGKSFTVKRGDMVFIALRQTVRKNPFTENPNSFSPERFLPDRKEQDKAKWGMPYFGVGSRVCAGRKFAEIQILLLLSILSEKNVHVKVREPPVIVGPALNAKFGCWVSVLAGPGDSE